MIPLQTFWSSYMYMQVTYMSFSETQGLLGGTMWCFWMSNLFSGKSLLQKQTSPWPLILTKPVPEVFKKYFSSQSVGRNSGSVRISRWPGLSTLEVNFRPKVLHHPDYQPLGLQGSHMCKLWRLHTWQAIYSQDHFLPLHGSVGVAAVFHCVFSA